MPGVGPCRFAAMTEPDGWRMPGFDDTEWPTAVEFSAAEVRPKDGYDAIGWRDGPRLIWTADLVKGGPKLDHGGGGRADRPAGGRRA